jgi:hypothetical protein
MLLKRFLQIRLGIVTRIGGFLEMGSITTTIRIAKGDLRHAK